MDLQNQNSPEPVVEDPSVVVGGPLDLTAPEAQPPEGHVVGADPQSQPAGDPFYRGLTGDIKSPEEMKDYAKRLEDLLVQQQARNMATTPAPIGVTPPAPAPVVTTKEDKERFSELIFSKPDEAFEIAVNAAQARMNHQLSEKERITNFWAQFYQQNPDLKRVETTVQSVLRERSQQIGQLKTEKEVAELLSRESRNRVNEIKQAFGYTETKLPSQNAVALGGSRESVPQPPKTPAAPVNFADQIRKLRPSGKVRQA